MGVEYSHETRPSHTTDYKDGHRYSADFDSDYFAKGTYRYAFRGTVHGEGPRDGRLCVTKAFKRQYADQFDNWLPDVAASRKSQDLARAFSKYVIPTLDRYLPHGCAIEFVIPLIAKMESVSHYKVLGLFAVGEDSEYVSPHDYVAIEPYLRGEFEKYNSNGGYEDPTADLLTTFSHWTWCATGHRYLVCDLQGVQAGRRFLLTDPCVHSTDRRYGMTDLGVVGMEHVLAGHTCNSLCRALKLTNPMSRRMGDTQSMPTVYEFELPQSELYRTNEARSRFFKLVTPSVT